MGVVFDCLHHSDKETRLKILYSVSKGHKDSVTCAVFNHDSSLVASGDMSGLIKVWKIQSKEEIWSFEVGDLEVCAQSEEFIIIRFYYTSF